MTTSTQRPCTLNGGPWLFLSGSEEIVTRMIGAWCSITTFAWQKQRVHHYAYDDVLAIYEYTEFLHEDVEANKKKLPHPELSLNGALKTEGATLALRYFLDDRLWQ
eukprot:TRINITY_DN19129_c0_g1_i1.p1 TRINITY_DN19129_c0_g1~~TRINITY_DN19129_c0_g1_i1.p1  ORF type:complete len:106 (+),score=5.25 TRINITY_DN19129_c0_g1_i1:828-1145(+)